MCPRRKDLAHPPPPPESACVRALFSFPSRGGGGDFHAVAEAGSAKDLPERWFSSGKERCKGKWGIHS